MMKIWHNTRCGTSRKALKILESKGFEPEVYRYLDEKPTEEEILAILKKLEMRASDLIRKKEALYKELQLKDADEAALIKAMSEHARLIEHPIIEMNERALVARPAELAEGIQA